jgi:hypothetical protein
MTMFLNCAFDDGERLALDIATVKGWGDFCRWAGSLSGEEFALVRDLAAKGSGQGSRKLEDQLKAALAAQPPGRSAAAVVRRLIEVVPHEGKLVVSDQPDDSEAG